MRNTPPPQPIVAPSAALSGPPVLTSAISYDVRSREVREPIRPLWITGTVLLSVAYTYSIVVGSIFLTTCCTQGSWAMYIPIVGGFIWPAIKGPFDYSVVSEAMGIPAAALQSVGLVLLISGLLARRTRDVPVYGSVIPAIAPGPGDAGLGLRWDF